MSCAARQRVYKLGPELQLDVSTVVITLRSPVLHLDMSTPSRGSSFTQTCLHHTEFCAAEVSTPQGSELHLAVSGQQEPELLLHGYVYTVERSL